MLCTVAVGDHLEQVEVDLAPETLTELECIRLGFALGEEAALAVLADPGRLADRDTLQAYLWAKLAVDRPGTVPAEMVVVFDDAPMPAPPGMNLPMEIPDGGDG